MAEYVNHTDTLELRAAEERKRLHQSMQELRGQIHGKSLELREKLDVKKNAREHFWPAAGGLSLFGLLLGYGVAAVFVKSVPLRGRIGVDMDFSCMRLTPRVR